MLCSDRRLIPVKGIVAAGPRPPRKSWRGIGRIGRWIKRRNISIWVVTMGFDLYIIITFGGELVVWSAVFRWFLGKQKNDGDGAFSFPPPVSLLRYDDHIYIVLFL